MSRLDIGGSLSAEVPGESEPSVYRDIDRDIERASRLNPKVNGVGFIRESRSPDSQRRNAYQSTKARAGKGKPKSKLDVVGLIDDAGPNARHAAKGSVRRTRLDRVTETFKTTGSVFRPDPDGQHGEGNSDREPEPIRTSQHNGDRPGSVATPVSEIPINSAPPREIPGFQKAVFEAMVDEIKFNNIGNLIVRMIVPYKRDINEALKLKDAFGVMLVGGWYRKDYSKKNPTEVDHG